MPQREAIKTQPLDVLKSAATSFAAVKEYACFPKIGFSTIALYQKIFDGVIGIKEWSGGNTGPGNRAERRHGALSGEKTARCAGLRP